MINNSYHPASGHSPFLERLASGAHGSFQVHFCEATVSTEAVFAALVFQTSCPSHLKWLFLHWFDLRFPMLVAAGLYTSWLSYFFGLLVDVIHFLLQFCHRGCLLYHFQAAQNSWDYLLGCWKCSRLWQCLGQHCDMLQLQGLSARSFWCFE